MATECRDVSAKDFLEAAEFLAGGYDIGQPWTLSARDPETRLFKGDLATRQLSCGLRLSTCDITALFDSVYTAEVPRSLFIALAIDGDPADYAFGSGRGLPLRQGGAIRVSAADTMTMVGRYREGQRFKSLVILADPATLQDEQLAEKVDARLTSTAWEALQFLPRALCLTGDMWRRDTSDCVSALLLESCALEMLARSLQAAPMQAVKQAVPISRKDRERMSLVHDALTSAPDHPHRLCELARNAGVSVTSLKTKFSAVFGQTVFAVLRDIRLERARKGLEDEGWTVSQAAYYSGFRHVSNFSAAFRRKYSISPSKVRRP